MITALFFVLSLAFDAARGIRGGLTLLTFTLTFSSVTAYLTGLLLFDFAGLGVV